MQRASEMNPKNRKILHFISKSGTYMFLYGLIYMILNYILGQVPVIKNISIISDIPLSLPLNSILTVTIISKFIRVSSPYDPH